MVASSTQTAQTRGQVPGTVARLVPFGTSIFAEMTRLAVKHGAINLAQGFPDFDGPDHVKEAAIAAIRAGHGQYARSAGVPALTEALAAKFHAGTGLACDAESMVTVTAGCTEAIAATILGLCEPGDEVVLFEPYYDSYRACVEMAGATPRFVTLRGPDFAIDAAALERAFTARTKLVLVNTPHNPTGRVFTRDELMLVARLCQKFNTVAVADEVYEHLVYEPQRRPMVRLASLPGMAERTLTLSSLGKTFSLTGWKIGWAIGPARLSAAVRAAHQFLTFAVSTPMQHATLAALASPASYYDTLVRDYRRKRDMLTAALADLGFAVRAPEGSYFVYADHTPVSARLGISGDVALCTHLIERCGVAAIPPTAFYNDKAEGSKMIRFAFCKRDETLAAAIERLRSLG
jgi:L-glutamine---4-(methylsulfanyl)-2-oxobutanoate aminotransferase